MIRRFFLYMIILFASISCRDEQLMIFEENPSTRILKREEMVRNILSYPDNTWKMIYFPKINKNLYSDINLNMINLEQDIFLNLRNKEDFGYGGYTFFISFYKDGTLKMASDLHFNEEMTSGSYDLIHNTDVSLSFTSGNIIHKLKGSRFEGSADFIIDSISDDKIVLRTSKYTDTTNEFIVLHRIEKGKSWKTYMNAYKKTREEFENMREPYLIIKNAEGDTVFRSNEFLRNQVHNPTGLLDSYRRYILFLKVDDPTNFVKVTYLHGIGSGFSYNENGINFKPGLKYNNEILFDDFNRIGEKRYHAEKNGFTADIIEIKK